MTDLHRIIDALPAQYAVEGVIGEGGMATVWRAHDVKHDRDVAIKVLRPELDADGRERFLREVRIAARLSHPHILPLHDSGSAGDVLFYVMPLVKGESLRQRLERERQLPMESAVALVRTLAFALGYAHSQGVVHRDIKPENILLHEGEPILADFGIAIAAAAVRGSARLTSSGLAVGTPEYMSPEQALGDEEVDGRSDVYSLACVLFELLAGSPPFTGTTPISVITRRLVAPAPSVRTFRPEVPEGVDLVLMRALARVATERYPTAAAFAEALSAPGVVRPASPKVAVLPFRNLSADPDNEYFVDGITEDVIIHLSKLRTLDVISHASVMPFKQRSQGVRDVAASLGAGSLLDGSVRRAGNRVRIAAQLIDAATERQLWGETYDRELTDIFAIQSDVALQIASALRAELSPAERTRIAHEPTTDLHAYHLYLQGRHCLVRYTSEGLTKAIDYFSQASVCDPGFALAHTGMALAFIELGESGDADPDVVYAKARAAVKRALELDPELGAAHAAQGYLSYVADFDWEGAEQAFKRALALQPGDADAHDHYGRLCSSLGRFDEALALQRRAHELDPHAHRADVATAFLRAGRFDEALTSARGIIEFDPHYDRGYATLGWALLYVGRHDEAIVSLERAVALSPDKIIWVAQLGEALGLVGRTEEARAILRRLEEMASTRYVSPYHMAYVHTGLGEADAAIDYLERASAERSGAIYGVRGSFLFASIREHPRFVALLQRMKLA